MVADRNHVVYDVGVLKAIVPLIIPSANGSQFDWQLPSKLSAREHRSTTAAAKKHLMNLPDQSSGSDAYNSSDLNVLNGALKIISSVNDEAETKHGEISVSGVVAAILRFQGVVHDDRDNLDTVVERIETKVVDVLMSEGDGEVAAEQDSVIEEEQDEASEARQS